MRLAVPLGAALFYAAPMWANAQTAPPAPDDATIVVEGARLTRDEARVQAAELIRNTATVPELGQYARWNRAICPSVIGIAPVYAAIVVDRIRAAADEAGAKLARPGCQPNLVIGFASDGRWLADHLRRRAPNRVFAAARTAEKAEFVKSDRAVRWLYSLGAGSEGGASAIPNADQLGVIGSPVGDSSLPGFGDAIQTTQYGAGSLIRTNLVVSITGALVVVDIRRAEGVPLGSVANYVARVALAQTRLPPREGQATTVLQLFDRAPDPTAVTPLSAWDRAYLKAIYRIPGAREGWIQRSRIQGELVNALASGS